MKVLLNVELADDVANEFLEWCIIERDKKNDFQFYPTKCLYVTNFTLYISIDECLRVSQFLNTLEEKTAYKTCCNGAMEPKQ